MLEAANRDSDEAGRSRDPLITLVELIEELSSARTVEQIADVVRSAARRITGADGVAFILRDGDNCYYLDEDAIGPLWKGRRFPMSACISGWAMLNRQVAVIPDIYQDDRIPHDAYRPTFVKSLVMTPVRPNNPIAAIGAYWAQARRPTDDEVRKLEIMARATATALDSAQVYASLSEALERRKFLLRELDHRCKNTMAAVQSLADQTLRRAPSPEHFVEAFNGRIGALARAHELLTRGAWGNAKLSEVIGQALTPFCGAPGLTIAVSGPDIALTPETAVAMHLTVHELAVNATKYGALSVTGGRLDVAWSVDHVERAMDFRWVERGGPPVTTPTSRGFGSRLIEHGVSKELGGRSEMLFDPEGLQFHMRAPLSARISLA